MRSLLRKYTLPGFIICALGLAGLFALYAAWLFDTDYSLWAYLAAMLSVALFALVCLRFVPGWMRFWGGQDGPWPRCGEAAEPAGIRAKLALAGFLYCFGVFLICGAIYFAAGRGSTLRGFLDFWECLDSGHYIDIARDWYLSEGDRDRLVQLVFLPGYPLLMRLTHLFVRDWVCAGLLTSWLCFAGALSALYSLFRLDYTHERSLRAVITLLLIPGGFFFAAPMSESLFLLLSALCVYLARRGRYLPACLMGALAAFTRSLGLMLFVPVCMELVRSLVKTRRGYGRLACLLLIPAGFGAYVYINYLVSGNPFQYMVYQEEHWGQSFGLFFATAAYQTDYAIRRAAEGSHDLWGLWIPNLAFSLGALAVMARAARRMRPSYSAWFIAYYFVAIGATWLLSAPRYLLSLAPFVLAVSEFPRTGRGSRAMGFALLACSLMYAVMFVLRWQVW